MHGRVGYAGAGVAGEEGGESILPTELQTASLSSHVRNKIVDLGFILNLKFTDILRLLVFFVWYVLTHAGIACDGVHGDAAALHLPLVRVPGEAVLRSELPRAELREAHRHAATDGLRGNTNSIGILCIPVAFKSFTIYISQMRSGNSKRGRV